jgi:hypothetical protein
MILCTSVRFVWLLLATLHSACDFDFDPPYLKNNPSLKIIPGTFKNRQDLKYILTLYDTMWYRLPSSLFPSELRRIFV